VPIVANSSIQLLLKQSPSAIEVLQQTFNLTDEEKYLLLESGIGEGIFFAGLKHVAIKIVASYTEEQIITTNPEALIAIKRAKQELAVAEGQVPAEERKFESTESAKTPIIEDRGLPQALPIGAEAPILSPAEELQKEVEKGLKIKEEIEQKRKKEAAKKSLEDKGLKPTEEDIIKALGEEIESLEKEIKW
jgi:hypothetical protein